jgi:hypothetical protein
MADDEPLTEEERRALLALPRESPVPAGFEERVVESLRSRGLVAERGPRTTSRRSVLSLGAAAGVFGAGLGAGLLAARRSGGAPEPFPGSQYLLLLYPGPRFAAGGQAEEAARVREYGAWAGSLRRKGQLVSAARLTGGATFVEADGADGALPVAQGFFLISARDRHEADAIARACPHLRHGGRVAVQLVDGPSSR